MIKENLSRFAGRIITEVIFAHSIMLLQKTALSLFDLSRALVYSWPSLTFLGFSSANHFHDFGISRIGYLVDKATLHQP